VQLQSEEQEISKSLPPALKKYIAAWAKWDYHEYEFGYILGQELQAGPFRVLIWRVQTRQNLSLYPLLSEAKIVLHCMLQGNMHCLFPGRKTKELIQSHYELFYIPRGRNELQFEPGLYESMHIELEAAYLTDIGDSYPEIRGLLKSQLKWGEPGYPSVTTGMNYVAKNVIRNLRNCSKQAGSLKLEMQKFILELVSEYIAGLSQESDQAFQRTVPQRKTLVRIRETILEAPNIHEHTIKKLSERFAISPTALKSGFRILFQVSLGTFIRFHALTKAHYLIASTDRTIDDIADEIGYLYRANFDQAFKRQFGYFPATVRRDMGTSIGNGTEFI